MNFNFITLDAGSAVHITLKRQTSRAKANANANAARSSKTQPHSTPAEQINLLQLQRQQVFPSSLLFDLLSVERDPNSLLTLLFPFRPPQTEQRNMISLHFVILQMYIVMLFTVLVLVKLMFKFCRKYRRGDLIITSRRKNTAGEWK